MYEDAAYYLSQTPTPSAVEIAERLYQDAERRAGPGGEVARTPEARTIREWIDKGWIDRLDRPSWTNADSPPEDWPLVLDVIKALVLERDPYRPSRGEAGWIVRIRRAFPEFDDLILVLHLARLADRGGAHLETAERILAFTPWRDECKALAMAVNDGLLGFEVAFAAGCEAAVAKDSLAARKRKEGKA